MRIKSNVVVITLIVLLSAFTNMVNYVVYSVHTVFDCSYVYNRGFQITVFSVFVLGFFIMSIAKLKVLKLKAIYGNFFLMLLILSVVTVPFILSFDFKTAAIGWMVMLSYVLLYMALYNTYSLQEIYEGLCVAFKVLVLIEAAVGFLDIFFNISIPYVTGYRGATNIQTRNGILRMSGTFGHAGDFSLYITICMLFFVCRYLFSNKKIEKYYVILCYIMVLMSGARTTFLLTTVGLLSVYVIRNRKNKLFFLLLFVLFLVLFLVLVPILMQSYFYQSIISMDSEEGSIWLRISFWFYGLNIVFENMSNFIFGVGINHQVAYSTEHYMELIRKLPSWLGTNYTNLYYTYPVHNAFIVMFAELGLFGGIAYIGIFVSFLRNAIRNIKEVSFTEKNVFVLLSFGSFVFYALQGWGILKQPIWVLIVLLLVFCQKLKEEPARIRRSPLL